jgi:hypothetical protein
MVEETITKGLGIEDSWWETATALTEKSLETTQKISDAIQYIGSVCREEEFGETSDIPVSIYEKKLILIGMLMGQSINNKIVEHRIAAGLARFGLINEDNEDDRNS